jgi:S-phase kinase-associated protein 1
LQALAKVIEYCQHHENDKPAASTPETEYQERSIHTISSWDKAFMNVEMGFLFEIILVRANARPPPLIRGHH